MLKIASLLSLIFIMAASLPNHADETRSSKVSNAPKITFPHDKIDRLSTTVAWMAEAQMACEVRVCKDADVASETLWGSGEVACVESHLHTPPLPYDSTMYAFARVKTAAGWSAWSTGRAFATPDGPVVRITQPTVAARVRGPLVAVAWALEAHGDVVSQSVTLDDRAPISVPPGERSVVLEHVSDGVHTLTLKGHIGDRDIRRDATFYVYSLAQQHNSKLYTLDLSSLRSVNVDDPAQAARAFDTLHVMGVLQGLTNRESAQLYVSYIDVDEFWLRKIREKGAYLEHAQVVPIKDVEDAISRLAKYVKGVVVWDPSVPATSNVASTVCGAESLLPVRYDPAPGSMYDRIVQNGPKLKVVRNLVGMFTGKDKIPSTNRDSTGSRKCDAYLWAKIHYLDTGKCNPREIGYWCDAFWLQQPKDMSLDNVGLTNHDFVVARKGFICDLNVWPDEAPRDEPGQEHGLDRKTLQEILLSCYNQSHGAMIHFSGFTPWAIKYTNHGNAGGIHDPVPTEWETARLASAYNCYMDADAIGYAGMANASVFSLCKLPDRLVQNPPPTRSQLEASGYIDAEGRVADLNFIYHYLGDYDSAAWMYHRIPAIWQSPVRGEVPSGWAFNPNLIERMPVVFDWCYETKAPNDYFVGGDSGAGYINPTQLIAPRMPSGLPGGEQAWIDHNIKYYQKLNYSIVGFVINGFCGQMDDEANRMFLPFCGDGIMTQTHWMPKSHKDDHLLGGVPIAGMKQDITAPVDQVVEWISKYGKPGERAFLSFRSILVGPDWIKAVNDKVRAARPECRFEPVDPYTYFHLLRQSLGGANEKRATYTFDTIPPAVRSGRRITAQAGVRNDGWDTWRCSGADAVALQIGFEGRSGGVMVPLTGDVAPGAGAVLSFELNAPATAGSHTLSMEMVKGKDGYFGDAHDLPWEKEVTVR